MLSAKWYHVVMVVAEMSKIALSTAADKTGTNICVKDGGRGKV